MTLHCTTLRYTKSYHTPLQHTIPYHTNLSRNFQASNTTIHSTIETLANTLPHYNTKPRKTTKRTTFQHRRCMTQHSVLKCSPLGSTSFKIFNAWVIASGAAQFNNTAYRYRPSSLFMHASTTCCTTSCNLNGSSRKNVCQCYVLPRQIVVK